MTPHEMAENLLWDFAQRAQEDEDRAYSNYQRFRDASYDLADEHFARILRRLK